MYCKKRIAKTVLCPLLCFFMFKKSNAQLTLTGQLRTRTEFRDGQGSPLPIGASPAFFTSQRTRVMLTYNIYRVKLGVTAQDVRVWGQDVSTINRTTTADNNALMFHEAWAEILLTDTTTKNRSLSLKIGRQELSYDDERLIGKLDWLQQGRRHDAALLKFETGNFLIHTAFAFNQNKENTSGTVYNSIPPGNYTASTNAGAMYKSMEMLYTGKKLKQGSASFLFFADQFSKYHNDSLSAKIFETGTWARFTTGFYFNNTFNKVAVIASAYYQFGKNPSGKEVSAYLLGVNAQYHFSKKFNAGIGADYYSGGTSGATSNTFDPLYGTPHKFAGLMDYFYASAGFGNGGLVDYYVKIKYKPSDKFQLAADMHQFNSAAAISNTTMKNFGQEIDVTGTYSLTEIIGFEAGYAHFLGTSLIASPTVKNVPNANLSSNWAYLQINIRPQFLFSK